MEKLWGKYQSEGVARNMSIQEFCSMHNVPYNSFEKYLKTRRNMSQVFPVTVTDAPSETNTDNNSDFVKDIAQPNASDSKKAVRILISIKMNNGLSISKGNLNYHELRELVEKLEVLC